MKITVIGAGSMGRAAARDLVESKDVEQVQLLESREAILKEGAAFAGDVIANVCDASDYEALKNRLEGYDVALSCVPYNHNLNVLAACLAAKCSMVDLGGNNDVVDAQYALSEKAKEAGITVIPDAGLAPGMVGIWAMAGADELDECEYVNIYCGGLPVEPKPPLNYMRVFSINGLINEYIEPCRIVEDGEVKTVPGMSGVEIVNFDPPFEEMEAFYTSGGTSTLINTLGPRVVDLEYKTLRYPGHIQHFQTLHDLGLTRAATVNINGINVSPRKLLEKLLKATLPGVGDDLILMRVDCEGELDEKRTLIRYDLLDYADSKSGMSAMMRCTALPAAAIARMIGNGTITLRGTQPQELVVPPEELMKQLLERGVKIEKSVLIGEEV